MKDNNETKRPANTGTSETSETGKKSEKDERFEKLEALVTQLKSKLDHKSDQGRSNSASADYFEARADVARELRKLLDGQARDDRQQADIFRDEVDEKLEHPAADLCATWKKLLDETPGLTIDVGRRLLCAHFAGGEVVATIVGTAPSLSHPLGKEVSLMRSGPKLILKRDWDGNPGPQTIHVPGRYGVTDPTHVPS